MKKLYYLIILALILGLVLTGCSLLSNISQVPTTNQSGITYLTKGVPEAPDVFTLYADQNIPVGTVSVWNDCDSLYVKYETTGGWVMTETHLAVVADFDDFPLTKKKNPKVGLFPYQCCYDETEEEWLFVKKPDTLGGTCEEEGEEDATLTEITYIIPLGSDIGLYIAAHASLLKLVDIVDVDAEEEDPTCSNVTLESGKRYLLKVSGVADAGANIDFDAKYSISGRYPLDTWTDLVTGYEVHGPGLLELKVDGKFVDWGVYNPAHIYYWNMDGIDSCVPLWIYDIHYGTNEGVLTVEIYQEETAWADGKRFTKRGNWATYFTYEIENLLPTISSEDLAGPFTAGEPGEFSVTTVNPDPPCGLAYSAVLFNYTMFGIEPSNIVSFEYYDEGTATWYLAPVNDAGLNVTGYFGPWPDGFPMSAPYNETTDFKITFDAAVTGIYNVVITLNDLNNSNAELAILTQDVMVSPGTVLAVGDLYGGGIVAYIFVDGDPDYDANEQHGLIAATGDQSDGAQWGCYGASISGADGTAVGTGEQNTIDIEAGCTTAGIAAEICANLILGGCDDWFLPSKDELNLMYTNLHTAAGGAIGGFADGLYWSSSEYDAYNAWLQDFRLGGKFGDGKYISYRVRAVRAF